MTTLKKFICINCEDEFAENELLTMYGIDIDEHQCRDCKCNYDIDWVVSYLAENGPGLHHGPFRKLKQYSLSGSALDKYLRELEENCCSRCEHLLADVQTHDDSKKYCNDCIQEIYDEEEDKKIEIIDDIIDYVEIFVQKYNENKENEFFLKSYFREYSRKSKSCYVSVAIFKKNKNFESESDYDDEDPKKILKIRVSDHENFNCDCKINCIIDKNPHCKTEAEWVFDQVLSYLSYLSNL